MYNLLRMLNLDSDTRTNYLELKINIENQRIPTFMFQIYLPLVQPEKIVYSMFTESISARLSLTIPYIPTHCCFACHGFLHATFAWCQPVSLLGESTFLFIRLEYFNFIVNDETVIVK